MKWVISKNLTKMSTIAIITARGGSKRIPRKNIKDFLGKPIIKYSIDAAIQSGCFDEVIVSTDDNEIANLSKIFGIYPTAPFVNADKILKSYSKLVESGAKAVVPIVKFGFPILRSFKLENGMVKMNWPQYLNTRSQDLPQSYHDAGQFYFFRVDAFLNDNKIFTDETIGIEMPESEVQDIDNEEDWKIAEIKYTFLMNKPLTSGI